MTIGLLHEQEIGPYEMGWKRRKHTWANEANLLFIDNPVGTGWSYVEKHGKFGKHSDLVCCSADNAS